MTLPRSVNGVRLRNGVGDARVTQHLDYWLLTARELQQYLSWTEEAARAYKQMEPVIRQAAKDWARISATAQKHVAKIARFRAKREKQNERTQARHDTLVVRTVPSSESPPSWPANCNL